MDDFRSKYNTPLPPEAVGPFIQWSNMMSQKLGRDVTNDNFSYDITGYFLSGLWKDQEGTHMTDQFKKPNHITFSDQSIYHGVDGNEGGQWNQQDGKWSYKPGKTTLDMYGVPRLQEYFNKYEPDSYLELGD